MKAFSKSAADDKDDAMPLNNLTQKNSSRNTRRPTSLAVLYAMGSNASSACFKYQSETIMAIERSSFKKGAKLFPKSLRYSMRRPDQFKASLHFWPMAVPWSVSAYRNRNFIPVILLLKRSWTPAIEIYDRVVCGNKDDAFTAGRIEMNTGE